MTVQSSEMVQFVGRFQMQTHDGRMVDVEGVRAMDIRSLEGRSALTGDELPGSDEQQQVRDLFDDDHQPMTNYTVAMEYNPQEWIEERLAFWQRQLRLQDWEIQVIRATALEVHGKSGLTWAETTVKEAKIHILKREEWPQPSQAYGIWDEEIFLVHELMHLHLMAWESGNDREKNPCEFEAKEMAIDLTTTALVRLQRGQVR